MKLKELGFDEECLAGWSNIYSEEEPNGYFLINFYENLKGIPKKIGWHLIKLKAPLWQQVIDWFREKYNINIIIQDPLAYNISHPDNKYGFDVELEFLNKDNRITSKYIDSGDNGFITYYEARKQAILKSIELCQKEE